MYLKNLRNANIVVVHLDNTIKQIFKRRWPNENTIIATNKLSDLVGITIFTQEFCCPFVAPKITSTVWPFND